MVKIALLLTILGALNWLFVGLFEWDPLAYLLGGTSRRELSGSGRILYTLIGLAGCYSLALLFQEEHPEVR